MAVPYEQEAEAYVLGCMLISPKATAEVLRTVAQDDFFEPRHQVIFEAISTQFLEANGAITPVLVIDRLRRMGKLNPGVSDPNERSQEITSDFIAGLMDGVGSTTWVKEHADIILNRSHARRLKRIMNEGDPIGMSEEELTEMARSTEDLIDRMRWRGQERTGFLSDMLAADLETIEAYAGQGRIPGLASGFDRLDAFTGGFRRHQLITIGGRPGMGKSAICSNIAVSIALGGHKVAFFTLEMSSEELRMRILAQQSTIPLQLILTGNLSDDQWAEATAIAQKLSEASLAIDERKGLTLTQISAEARRLRAIKGSLDLIVIDYVQLMNPTDPKLQRYEQIGQITAGLKQLAGELNVPVIIAAQLGRQVEERKDKEPRLGDLRESGAIEQDSDIVLYPFRPNVYDKTKPLREADLLIAKHRNGPTGKIKLLFEPSRASFHNAAAYTLGNI